MRRTIKAIFFVLTFSVLTLGVFPVAAQIKSLDKGDCDNLGIKCKGNDTVEDFKATVISIVNIFLGLIALLAAIILVVAGVRYIISQGDDKAVEKAKNTILYAVIGLIVIGLAAITVNFVVSAIRAGGGAGQNQRR
jgi:hypothetical protein